MNYRMLLKTVYILTTLLLSGCSSNEPKSQSIFDNEIDQKNVATKHRDSKEAKAYKEGLKDAATALKTRQSGRERYVYEEAELECGVKIPARVVGGILYPEHEACVQYAEGRYVLRQTKNDRTIGN